VKQLLFIVIMLNLGIISAQTSDATLLKFALLKGNNIGISAYNDGAISGFRQGIDIRGEWPLGSGENYIGDITPCLGVELPIKDYNGDGIDDIIHSVIISRGPRYGQGDEKQPIYGYFWGFNPVTNYVNENSNTFAISDDQTSWSPNWGGVWPGLYNSGEIIANKEAFFKMDDYWDDEFNNNFYPFNSDTSITGLGIEVAVRYLQFNTLGLEDVFFRVYDITNNSDYDYEKVFLGNITGTLMGGDGDSGDDLAAIDDSTGIIYSWDYDGIGNHGQRTATMGEAFIESPSMNEVGEFFFFAMAASTNMSNDSLLWIRFTQPNPYKGVPSLPMDGDMLYSTKLFSLNAKETKRIVSVIAFGPQKEQVEDKIFNAEALWHNQFNSNKMKERINFKNYSANAELSNIIPIEWESNYPNGKIDLYYSGNFGKIWIKIANTLPNNGNYSWNSSEANIEESAFAQIKVILRDENNYIIGNSYSNYFLLNNNGNGKPILEIENEDLLYSKTLTENNVELSLLIGDSEKENLTLNVYYKTSNEGSYELIDNINYSFSNVAHLFNLNLVSIPNSDDLYLKFLLNDSENEFIYETEKIRKFTDRQNKPSHYLSVISGYSESNFNIRVVDEEALQSERYLVTFDDTTSLENVFYNINKISDGSVVLKDELLLPNIESKLFNGIVFETDLVKTSLDVTKSKWNSNVLGDFLYTLNPFVNGDIVEDNGYALPNDYKIIFYENIVDTSIVDTIGKKIPPFKTIIPALPVNFKVWNTTNNMEVDFTALMTGTMSSVLSIWLHENNLANTKRTWRINISYPESQHFPVGIDTLTLITQKGFSVYDTLIIEDLVVDVKDENNIPTEYKLFQNYPNPFNPSTTIKYSIPTNVKSEMSNVKLVVYDILGREVVTLVNKVQKQGNYEVNFNASNITSGIYFYRLQSGNFSESKKMILIK